jgi:hypothetical protein
VFFEPATVQLDVGAPDVEEPHLALGEPDSEHA